MRGAASRCFLLGGVLLLVWGGPTRAQQPSEAERATPLLQGDGGAEVEEASGAEEAAERTQQGAKLDPELDRADEGSGSGPEEEEDSGGPSLAVADIASHFSAGVIATAKRALDRGDFRRAQRVLSNEEPSRLVRHLQALAAARAGDPEALPLLQSLADEDALLRPYYLYEAARLQERKGKLREALGLFQEIGPENVLYPRVRTTMARLYERLGQRRRAARTLVQMLSTEAPALDDRERAAGWKRVADLSRKLGDGKGAHRAHLALWALHPLSPEGKWAERRLRGQLIPNGWKLTRGEKLVALHQHAAAVRLLKQVRAQRGLSQPLSCRATFALGTVRRKERAHAEAIRLLQPLVEACAREELHPRLLFVLGNSQSVLEPETAVATYKTLAELHPAHPYADDGLLHAASLLEQRDDTTAALTMLERVSASFPAGDMAAEALFRAGRLLRRLGRNAEALGMLSRTEGVAGSAGTHEQVLRARYWRALTLIELQRLDEGLAAMEQVADEGALNYYGLIARGRLAEHDPARAARVVQRWTRSRGDDSLWPLALGRLAEQPLFVLGLELLRLDHPHAPETLLLAVRQAKGAGAARLVFHVLNERNYRRYAAQLADGSLGRGISTSGRRESRLLHARLYPSKYSGWVRSFSRAARVDPVLMQALIREESGFNPRTRSGMGALGLSQLLPTTATLAARSMGKRGVSADRLLQPKDNIQLGAHYLGMLFRQLDENVFHAVAAYNAGPGAVRTWKRRSPESQADAFVEDIPFDETRAYVKRVLGSYSAYQLLHDPNRARVLSPASGTLQPMGAGRVR